MVDCETFLREYSALRDDAGPLELRASLRRHRDGCADCARYDRVVRGGTEQLRALPELEPSPDFAFRLEHRLLHEQERMRLEQRRGFSGATAGALSVAATIAAMAWIPVVRSAADGSPQRLPAAVASAPAAGVQASFASSAGEHRLNVQLTELGVAVWRTPYDELLVSDGPLALAAAPYRH